MDSDAGGTSPDFMISPNDHDMMVRAVIGEAGGEPDVGKVGVAHVILNRVASGQYPNSPTGVVTQAKQFESIDSKGAQLAAIPSDDPRYQSAAKAVDAAISGAAPDPTGGALNFYAPQLQSDLGRSTPKWAGGPSVQIGRHVFSGGTVGQQQAQRQAVPPGPTASIVAAPAGSDTGSSGLSDGDLDAMLSGRTSGTSSAAPSGGGNDLSAAIPSQGSAIAASAPPATPSGGVAGDSASLSDTDLDAMLSGKVPAAPSTSAASAPVDTDGARPLTIHGPAAPTPATALPAAAATIPGAAAPLQGGAFQGNALTAASAVPPAAPGNALTNAAPFDPEGTGPANYDTSAAPSQADFNTASLNLLVQAGKSVPFAGALVNPLAARLASVFNGKSVDDNTATGNALSAAFEAEHPYAAGAARIAGAGITMGPLMELAPGAFGLGQGGNLLSKMLASGSTNALLNGGDAVVRGEDPFSGGLLGNSLRYGAGILAPGIGPAAGALVKGGGNALGGVINQARNYIATGARSGVAGYTPEEAGMLSKLAGYDGGAGAVREAAQHLGPGATMADVGPSMQGLALGFTTKPSEAKTAIETFARGRDDGTNARVQADVNSNLGPAQNPTPVRQAIQDAQSALTEPLFQRAYEAAQPWTPELDALSQRPAVTGALQTAATQAANEGRALPTAILDRAGNPVASSAPIDAYEAGTRPAVTAALADALGVDPATGPIALGDQLAAQRSAAADPLYAQWRSTPVPTTPEMVDLMSRPSVVDAIRGAQRKAADQGRSIFVTPEAEAAWERDPLSSTATPDLPANGPASAPLATMSPEDAYMDRFFKPTPPNVPRPQDARSVIRGLGGVRDSGGDLASLGVDEMGPGVGKLIQPSGSGRGVSADEAAHRLAELGYFGADTTAAMRNRSTSTLADALTNHPTYPEGEAAEAWAGHDRDMADWSQWKADTAGLSRHSDLPMPGRSAAPDYAPEDMGLAPGPAAAAARPAQFTAEGLDTIKQAIDDKISLAQRAGSNNDARIYTGLKNDLVGAVDNHPDPAVASAWQAARRAYAGPSREIDALDGGRRAFGDNVTREQMARDYSALATDGERQQFRAGLFGAASEKLARRPDGGNFADAIAGNQAVRDKLATVASSPEALGRLNTTLDQARQTFTETTRPTAETLHRALDVLDAKAAGGDAGILASRNALGTYLGQDPNFARGRALQGDYNLLTGALSDGATALRSGDSAIHPEDFAERFAGRTPAGQAAERIGIRNQVDRALGQKPNDLLALRNTLQGEDGWNAAKIGTAFGGDAGNALQGTVNRESTFREFANGVLHNSKSAQRLAGAALAENPAAGRTNLSGITTLGAPAQALKALLLDPAFKALLDSPTGPRNLAVAKALIAQGATRDQILSQLGQTMDRQAGMTAAIDTVAGAVKTGGNKLTIAASPTLSRAARSVPDNLLTRRIGKAANALTGNDDNEDGDNGVMRAANGSGRRTAAR